MTDRLERRERARAPSYFPNFGTAGATIDSIGSSRRRLRSAFLGRRRFRLQIGVLTRVLLYVCAIAEGSSNSSKYCAIGDFMLRLLFKGLSLASTSRLNSSTPEGRGARGQAPELGTGKKYLRRKYLDQGRAGGGEGMPSRRLQFFLQAVRHLSYQHCWRERGHLTLGKK